MVIKKLPASTTVFRRVLTAGLISIGVVSCGYEETECEHQQLDTQITVTGIKKIEVFRRLGDDSVEQVDENVAIPMQSLELRATMSYSRQPKMATNNELRFKEFGILDWFIGSAHACSPSYDGEIVSSVIDVDLISQASYGDGFDAGVSLSNAFLIAGSFVGEIDYGTTTDYYGYYQVPMEEFATEAAVDAAVAYILVPNSSYSNNSFDTSEELHQFTFSITLATGEMFTALSNPVLLSTN